MDHRIEGEGWPSGFLRSMAAPDGRSALTRVETQRATVGQSADWPSWTPPALVSAYGKRGIERPWVHQVTAAEHAWAGRSVVISTGTATGKSLGYQLPVLSRLLSDRRAKALYLSPTKALGHDQLHAIAALGIDPGGADGIRPAPYDGDTVPDERDWAREYSRWLFSNPDMLSRSILPRHARWHMFFRRLAYVVIDECHIYRGIFGSHIAHVIRRLRRICAKYGSEPTFILASATARDPGRIASELTGVPCAEVTDSQAPHGQRTIALWEPPLTELRGEHGAPVRRTAPAESARLLADLVIAGKRTLAFVQSRRSAEIVTLQAQDHLRDIGAHELAARVAAYRAGYLPDERRALEQGLNDGTLQGAAATTALELGIDIAGLDAVIVAGFPGTLASLWQQFGRAGRRQQQSLAVFVARDDPLDTFLVHHPEAIFDRPIEQAVIDPTNPYVLGPQLSCAAYELPITEAEVDEIFGGEAARAVLAGLNGVRRRPAGWFWVAEERPIADIRGSGGTVALIEPATGRLLGTVDTGAAPSTVFPGAVYLHRGDTWLVDELDLEDRVAMLHSENPSYTTYAQQHTDIRLLEVRRSTELATGTLAFVDVEVSSQVVSYQRRNVVTNEVIDQVPLDLPAQQLRTKAVMWTLDDRAVSGALGAPEEAAALLPGALHAAEHASIGLLPLIATCDRWDIGGVSTALHADTGLPTVFVYDGHPGGAGFAERAYERAAEWLGATLSAIEDCECASGCPSCIQSPKCGNGNEPLSKAGAIAVLRVLTAALG